MRIIGQNFVLRKIHVRHGVMLRIMFEESATLPKSNVAHFTLA